MIFLQEDEFKKSIRAGEFCRVYLLYGNESYLKQFYASLLADKTVGKDFSDFNLHKLEGKDTNLDEISNCVLTFPMMGQYTCTVIRDFDLLSFMGERGKTDEQFSSLINDLPESTVLVFWMDTIEVDEKNSKWSRLIKLIDANGAAVKLDKRSVTALCKLLEDSAAKKGSSISRDNSRYLISLVGDDISTLRNEFDKMTSYVGNGEITRAVIDKLAVVSVEAKIFSLSRDIVQGRADSAYDTLNNLFKLRTEPVVILAVLIKAYTDMYRVAAAKSKGIQQRRLTELFPGSYRGRDFLLNNASRDGGKYNTVRLGTALEALWDTDKALKTTSADGKIIMEQLLLRLMRI